MARRKQVAARSIEFTPAEEAAPPMAETATAVLEPPREEPPARQWRANPFPIKTVNLDGYKIQLRESRPVRDDGGSPEADASGDNAPERKRWEMQIKFGSGSKDDMPSGEVLDFIKSQRLQVTTRAGEEKEVQMFRWNDADRAWGMEISYHEPATSGRSLADTHSSSSGLRAHTPSSLRLARMIGFTRCGCGLAREVFGHYAGRLLENPGRCA